MQRLYVFLSLLLLIVGASPVLAQAPGGGVSISGRSLDGAIFDTQFRLLRPGVTKPFTIEGVNDPKLKMKELLQVRGLELDLPGRAFSQYLRLGRELRPERIVPGGDIGAAQGPLIDLIAFDKNWTPAQIKAASAGMGASSESACSTDVVDALDQAQRAVKGIAQRVSSIASRQPTADERLYLKLTDPALAAKLERPEGLVALVSLESAWRSVLSGCFKKPDAGEHWSRLKDRIGAFVSSSGAPGCTGLLMRDGAVLTARHCFFDHESGDFRHAQLSSMTFAVADGTRRLAVDLAKVKFRGRGPFAYEQEHFTVPVEQIGIALPEIPVETRIVALSDGPEAWRSITRLVVFATIPLAGVLDSANYPQSIAQPIASGCYVLAQKPNCVAHMCSVVPGSSGAGLFVSGSSSPRLVGIHLGPEHDRDVCTDISNSTANIAARGVNSQ